MKTLMFALSAAASLLCLTGTASAVETNLVCHSCCMPDAAVGTFTDKSLYQVDSKWTTDAGKGLRLGALAGRPQVVLMFFSHCTTACPILVHDLRQIEAGLTPAERTNVGFTLVSFDSERDTPKALAEYRREWNLPGNWTLLNGAPDDVLELAALLGVQYKKTADGQFAHSNVISLLDANGEILYQQSGVNIDPQEIIRRIEQKMK